MYVYWVYSMPIVQILVQIVIFCLLDSSQIALSYRETRPRQLKVGGWVCLAAYLMMWEILTSSILVFIWRVLLMVRPSMESSSIAPTAPHVPACHVSDYCPQWWVYPTLLSSDCPHRFVYHWQFFISRTFQIEIRSLHKLGWLLTWNCLLERNCRSSEDWELVALISLIKWWVERVPSYLANINLTLFPSRQGNHLTYLR